MKQSGTEHLYEVEIRGEGFYTTVLVRTEKRPEVRIRRLKPSERKAREIEEETR